MIYTKPQDHVIKITALDFGRGATTVVDGLDMPFGLAIDHYGQNLYWTDQGKINPHTPDRFTPSHAHCAKNCGSALTHR